MKNFSFVAVLALGLYGSQALAQATSDTTSLDALIARAQQVNPAITAAERRVAAAHVRIAPAGTLPDPMLMLGIQNLPLGNEAPGPQAVPDDRPDMMTMKMIGIGQTIPYPGKLRLERSAARHELASAEALLEMQRLNVSTQVRASYYDIALNDRALEILDRKRSVLGGFVELTEARYRVGTGTQQDVLRARVEATALAQSATALREQRTAALARLNALLQRESDAPLPFAEVSAATAGLAVADTARPRFVSAVIGARLRASPLPPLRALQQLAIAGNPVLRSRRALISAQRQRVELARKAHLPDIDLTLEYGQRDQRPDMISARIAVPLPVFKGRKQSQQRGETEAVLASLEAELQDEENRILARVAELHSNLERARTELALLKAALLPQAHAAQEAALAAYRVGNVDLLTLLENQAALFDYETEYFRLLSGFATDLAELTRAVGKEVAA